MGRSSWILAAALVCCAHPQQTPVATLRQYLQTLQRDDPKAAYALLDGPTKQRLSYGSFAAEWARDRAEREQQRKDLLVQLQTPLPTEAIVSLADGGRVSLIREAQDKGGFRLLDGDLRTLRAESPQEALRLLAAAAERRDLEAVLRLFSQEQRQQLEAELAERLSKLKAALQKNQPAELNGERAHYQYDPRYFIDLQRDAAGWHVFDLN